MLGKHYIVTGGTSGLGLEITKRLIKKGAHVTILARNKEKYKQINFKPFEKRVQMLTCDLQDKMLLACYHNISILKLTVSFIVLGLGILNR